MAKTYWIGSLDKCNLCGSDFGKKMYDARIRDGSWGNFCHSCWVGQGKPLGVGRGQKYELQDNGKWLKTGG